MACGLLLLLPPVPSAQPHRVSQTFSPPSTPSFDVLTVVLCIEQPFILVALLEASANNVRIVVTGQLVPVPPGPWCRGVTPAAGQEAVKEQKHRPNIKSFLSNAGF